MRTSSDLKRKVQVDGGSPITLAEFIEINSFDEEEVSDLCASLERDGRWIYGGGAAAEFHIAWARDCALLAVRSA